MFQFWFGFSQSIGRNFKGRSHSGASFERAGGRRPQGKRKKERKKRKKKKRKKRKKGTINNAKLLHKKCAGFFQFFNSPVALKNLKKNFASKKKLK